MMQPNKHDEQIDTVLAGLRDVDPAPGMNRRVLAAARERASLRPSSSWSSLRSAGLPRPLAAGLFAAAAVIVIALFAVHSRPGAAPPQQATLALTAPATLSPVSSPAPVIDARPKLLRTTQPIRDRSHMPSRESRLVSYPAPPMPLTQQEKLLLQVVHKHDPVEMAMLNPETRSRQQAEDRANFQKFFDPSTTKKN